jgi:hypothetical protein
LNAISSSGCVEASHIPAQYITIFCDMENKQATHHWFTTNLELIGLIYSSGFGAYVQYKAGLIADAGWGWGGVANAQSSGPQTRDYTTTDRRILWTSMVGLGPTHR